MRRIRSTDQMNTHSSNRNPPRVSWSTSPCIRLSFLSLVHRASARVSG
ncbi:Uncharacterised protein [Mycobacteroides abscessus subsp. abscessus]|nr:Uncharacterised protein [Mycobacteroides abscessus subsp. abscessus]